MAASPEAVVPRQRTGACDRIRVGHASLIARMPCLCKRRCSLGCRSAVAYVQEPACGRSRMPVGTLRALRMLWLSQRAWRAI